MKSFTILSFLIILFQSCFFKKQLDETAFFIKESSKPAIFYLDTWQKKNDRPQIKSRRAIADWEKAYGLIISYPLDLPYKLLKEITKNNKLIVCLKSNSSKRNAMIELINKDININNVKFVLVNNKSLTIQNIASFAIWDSLGFKELQTQFYNLDNQKNIKYKVCFSGLSKNRNIKAKTILNSNSLVVDGGNRLYVDINIFNDNKKNKSLRVLRKTLIQELGIKELIYFPLINDKILTNSIKVLDGQRILIKEPQFKDSEYLQLQISTKILKSLKSLKIEIIEEFKTEDFETFYLNSIIFNDTVFVPQYNIQYDTIALNRWKELMPNHHIIGCKSEKNQRPWTNGDALSQRVKIIHIKPN
jgi:agmatine deiminase